MRTLDELSAEALSQNWVCSDGGTLRSPTGKVYDSSTDGTKGALACPRILLSLKVTVFASLHCPFQIQAQHEAELKGIGNRLSESKVALSAAELRAEDTESKLSQLRQSHSQSLNTLEKLLGQALTKEFASARQKQGNTV